MHLLLQCQRSGSPFMGENVQCLHTIVNEKIITPTTCFSMFVFPCVWMCELACKLDVCVLSLKQDEMGAIICGQRT